MPPPRPSRSAVRAQSTAVRARKLSLHAAPSPAQAARTTLAWLKRHGTKRTLAEMARYGLPSTTAVGVPMATIKQLARRLGRNHALALALWDTECYEARLLATLVDDPGAVTPAQMDRWCRTFDNWGICDTACFALFDRTPHAWAKVFQWHNRREEFVKRAAFALLACLALHDRNATDAAFLRALPLIERAALDGRNFVAKGVSWALRAIGGRGPALHKAALRVAQRLATMEESPARWVGRDVLRDLRRPLVLRRVQGRR